MRTVGDMTQNCEVRLFGVAIHCQDEARHLGVSFTSFSSTSVAGRPITCTLFMSFLLVASRFTLSA